MTCHAARRRGEFERRLDLARGRGFVLVPGTGVNIFDVVNTNTLLFSKDSILQVQQALSR